MLKWYKNLYIGDNAKKKAPKIVWKVKHKKVQLDIYLVTLACNPENLLEIIAANQLLQNSLRLRCPMIVGIAVGYGEALELVQQIVTETCREQGDTDVRRYLEYRQKDKNRNRAGE
ncbi:MAG: hypothetical protein KH828_14320 [Clostridiales bacterium]|nr:hypothetical protein [Clostridiales bacterium]